MKVENDGWPARFDLAGVDADIWCVLLQCSAMGLEAPFKYSVSFTESGLALIVFSLSREEGSEFASRLEPVEQGVERVLRLVPDDRGSWVIYWKIRESENRAMYAHPESSEWVGTIALERKIFEELLKRLRTGVTFSLESLSVLQKKSNLRIEFRIS